MRASIRTAREREKATRKNDTPLRGTGTPIAGSPFNRRGIATLLWPDGAVDENGVHRRRDILRGLVYPAEDR